MSGTKHERAIEAAEEAGQAAWKKRSASSTEAWEAGIAAYQRVMREPGEGEVRVRVCVAVTETAGWQAYGADDADDERARNSAYFEEDAQYHFLEANVPAWKPPAEETVEGEVVG